MTQSITLTACQNWRILWLGVEPGTRRLRQTCGAPPIKSTTRLLSEYSVASTAIPSASYLRFGRMEGVFKWKVEAAGDVMASG